MMMVVLNMCKHVSYLELFFFLLGILLMVLLLFYFFKATLIIGIHDVHFCTIIIAAAGGVHEHAEHKSSD